MTEPKKVALAYLDACARNDQAALGELLTPDFRFTGPSRSIEGPEGFRAAIDRLKPIWLKTDVKKTWADGGDVCVAYDFVSDTAAGAVPCVERLRIEGGRVAQTQLLFDRVAFKPAADELERRGAAM